MNSFIVKGFIICFIIICFYGKSNIVSEALAIESRQDLVEENHYLDEPNSTKQLLAKAKSQKKPQLKKTKNKGKNTTHKTSKQNTLASAKVRQIQLALNRQGAKLKVDGKFGKNTRNAIRSFQKKNALKVTGQANSETVKKLKIR